MSRKGRKGIITTTGKAAKQTIKNTVDRQHIILSYLHPVFFVGLIVIFCRYCFYKYTAGTDFSLGILGKKALLLKYDFFHFFIRENTKDATLGSRKISAKRAAQTASAVNIPV